MTHSSTSAIILGLGVASSVIASGASSALFGKSIGSVSRERDLGITPRSPAFGIWAAIYALLIASVAFASSNEVSLSISISLGVAEALTALWVPIFLSNTPPALWVAAATLLASTGAAMTTVFSAGALRDQPTVIRAVSLNVAAALLAGWLLCASVLGIGIALEANGVITPRWALFVLGCVAAALAAASRNPVVAFPCVWALLWQRSYSLESLGGVAACALGVGVSLWGS